MVARVLLLGLFASITEAELAVSVYEGPIECAEADTVKVGDQIGIHYTGSVDHSSSTGVPGMQFASSRDHGVLQRTIGVGEVIRGWDEGLIGLCAGAKAILIIPPELGYGSHGVPGGVVPGGATLRFDIEIVSISPPPERPNLFEELDVDENGLLTPEEILVHFQRGDPAAEVPPGLMEKEDQDGDGVVSREEFGAPRLEWPMCLEMLYRNPDSTALGLTVQWLCQRDRTNRDAPATTAASSSKQEL